MNEAAQRWRSANLAWLVLGGWFLGIGVAHAHLIAPQKGTLNLVGDAGFLVLSVPVSSLNGADDNGDREISKAELAAHSESIRAQVLAGVQLLDTNGAKPLQLVMVDIAARDSAPVDAPTAASTHLLVVGRFKLDPSSSAQDRTVSNGLNMRFTLFGSGTGEQQQDLTITRQKEVQWLHITPEHPIKEVFPSIGAILADHIYQGASHVIFGADHLLFLLVVLSAGYRLRSIMLALTSFTAGHATTLFVCVWYGLSLPSRWVEPAIAATIVGMALFDRRSGNRGATAPEAVRLALVFACALIHGLGLAGALADLGLDNNGRVVALVGFNVGIEVVQIVVAITAATMMHGVRRYRGAVALDQATSGLSYLSIALGSILFFERNLS